RLLVGHEAHVDRALVRADDAAGRRLVALVRAARTGDHELSDLGAEVEGDPLALRHLVGLEGRVDAHGGCSVPGGCENEGEPARQSGLALGVKIAPARFRTGGPFRSQCTGSNPRTGALRLVAVEAHELRGVPEDVVPKGLEVRVDDDVLVLAG